MKYLQTGFLNVLTVKELLNQVKKCKVKINLLHNTWKTLRVTDAIGSISNCCSGNEPVLNPTAVMPLQLTLRWIDNCRTWQKKMKCVIPENIHTSPIEGRDFF